jgi:hypothetical protein
MHATHSPDHYQIPHLYLLFNKCEIKKIAPAGITHLSKHQTSHTYIKTSRLTLRTWYPNSGNKIEGLLPLFWGPALHIPFKIFCNPSKRKWKYSVNPSKWTAKKGNRSLIILCAMLIAKYKQTYLQVQTYIWAKEFCRYSWSSLCRIKNAPYMGNFCIYRRLLEQISTHDTIVASDLDSSCKHN